jgi:tetratricopeptide (TPR) repeat protein
MGLSLKDQGLFDQALNYYNMALEIREEFLDSSHPDVIAIKHNIGQLYYDKGDKDQAMKYFNNNLEILNKNEGN